MMPLMGEEMHEKCAVVGIAGDPEAASLIIRGLIAQQHRGSASSGLGGFDGYGQPRLFREPGVASKTYTPEVIEYLASLGLTDATGQDRYATSGPWDKHMQPVAAEDFFFSHNGNIPIVHRLDEELTRLNVPHANTNDSEKAGLILYKNLKTGMGIPDAICHLMENFPGALSCVAVIKDSDNNPVLAAFRDKYGIRPLALGKTKNGAYAFSSETYGLEAMGATYERDVRPGEIVLVQNGELLSYQVSEPKRKHDVFELIYFSHPDSLFYGERIGDIRREFGRQLAAEYREHQTVDRDLKVVGVPRSAVEAAEGFAEELGLEYLPAIIKNEDIRSFMEPDQESRERASELKYEYIRHLLEGQKVAFVDDSIVRGITAKRIIRNALEVGARSAEMHIASPPIRYSNHYGVNTPTQKELDAANFTIEEMRQRMNAQALSFLTLRGLMKVIKKMTGLQSDKFELSAINGDYPIPIGQHVIYKPVSDKYAEWAA